MLNHELTVLTDDGRRDIRFAEGQTVLEVLQESGITLTATCAGQGTCGKCRVLVEDEAGLSYRLACKTVAASGMLIFVDEPVDMAIQDLGSAPSAQPDKDATGYGIAIDVGTTTVVCRLYDLISGEALGTASRVNPQIVFGADVMSRIDASIAGKLGSMQELLLGTLHEIIINLCKAARIPLEDISRIGLAGNTVMQHIAAGLPPDSIGVAPFTPLSLFGDEHQLAALPAPVWFAPAIYGYVGGDITAGMVSVSMDQASSPQLLVDLGTNGEIALGDASGILCAATAAGPVFEGAGIHFGMPALPGAVASVRETAEGIQLEVIGGVDPIGICGSGLIDAVALMLREGIIDDSGRMLDCKDVCGRFVDRCGNENGNKVFYLTNDRALYVTQKDVRNLQLAKGAICAGIETLMEKRGTQTADIQTLYIAGGFGRALDLANAAIIGLFPSELRDRATSAGNTSIEGVSAAVISTPMRKTFALMSNLCSYVELSADSRFNELFIDALSFQVPSGTDV